GGEGGLALDRVRGGGPREAAPGAWPRRLPDLGRAARALAEGGRALVGEMGRGCQEGRRRPREGARRPQRGAGEVQGAVLIGHRMKTPLPPWGREGLGVA